MFRMIKEISEMLDVIKQGFKDAREDGTLEMAFEMYDFIDNYDSQVKD